MNTLIDAKINIDDLVDLRDVKIDLSLPVEEKKRQFTEQIGNPNLFRYGDTIIRVSHMDTKVSFKELIINYLLSNQGLSLQQSKH